MPLNETGVEFDEDKIDRIVSDVRDRSSPECSSRNSGSIRTGSWLIMRKNPLNKGIIMENAAGIGTVTSEMVEARARELAAINGRPSSEPSEADYQQAKRELTGETEMNSQEESIESIPESEGWDPVPGSTGRQAADSLGEDEDAEGRSESAQMFEEGISEAEHDQMRQASRADEQSDESEP
jgi:hypothetical protein